MRFPSTFQSDRLAAPTATECPAVFRRRHCSAVNAHVARLALWDFHIHRLQKGNAAPVVM
jgi:hypothetical protein